MTGYTPIATFARPRRTLTDQRTGQTYDGGTDNRAPMQQVPGTGSQGLAWIRTGSAGAYMGAQLNATPPADPNAADPSAGYDTTGIGYDHYHDSMRNYVGGAGQDGFYTMPGTGQRMNEQQFRKYTQDNWLKHGTQGQQAMIKKLAPIYGTPLKSLSPQPPDQGSNAGASTSVRNFADWLGRDRSEETGIKLLGAGNGTGIQRPPTSAPTAPSAAQPTMGPEPSSALKPTLGVQRPTQSPTSPAPAASPERPTAQPATRQLKSNDPALLRRLQAQGAPVVPATSTTPAIRRPDATSSQTPAYDALMKPAQPSAFMQTVQAAIQRPETTTKPAAPKSASVAAAPAPAPDPIKDPNVRANIIDEAARKNDTLRGQRQGTASTSPAAIKRPSVVSN